MEQGMRIGMLAPVSWPVPPAGYGPWEQVTANLTEELVRRGHDVTLFAAAGSRTSARLVATVPHAFSLWPAEQVRAPERLDPESGLLEGPPNFRVLEQAHIARCMEAAHDGAFDLVHSHLHVHALVFSRLVPCPVVSTLHGAAWVRAVHPVFRAYADRPFVSISDAERTFLPDLNYVATVYNGIRVEDFPCRTDKQDFLLFSGRLAPEKGVEEAIEIARRTDVPLRIAGMIEDKYRAYFDSMIRPHLDGRNVEYIGLLTQKELVPWYGAARALVLPIRWDEPFGLVAVEAQACGTAVLARRRGAMPEIVRDGSTGFLFETVDEAVGFVARLDTIDPAACRANAEQRFSAAAMADGYERVYRRLLEQRE